MSETAENETAFDLRPIRWEGTYEGLRLDVYCVHNGERYVYRASAGRWVTRADGGTHAVDTANTGPCDSREEAEQQLRVLIRRVLGIEQERRGPWTRRGFAVNVREAWMLDGGDVILCGPAQGEQAIVWTWQHLASGAYGHVPAGERTSEQAWHDAAVFAEKMAAQLRPLFPVGTP